MKNLLALSILLSVATISCNKGKSSTETSNKTDEQLINATEKLVVDSIYLKDSLKIDQNLTVNFQSKIAEFPTIKNKEILDSIYAPTGISLAEYSKVNLTDALKKNKAQFYDQQKTAVADWKPEFPQNWDNNSSMKVFSNQNNFLTIQYTQDGYTGGAHGYYNEIYKVFDLKNNKTIQLSDIVSDTNSSLWPQILMTNFLKNDSEKDQAQMLLVKEIQVNNNFYFDQENLYFLYNQYEITAYAAGTVLIKIPLSDIKPLLTDEFIARQSL